MQFRSCEAYLPSVHLINSCIYFIPIGFFYFSSLFLTTPVSKSKSNLFLVITSIPISRGISASTTPVIIFMNLSSGSGSLTSSLHFLLEHPYPNFYMVGKSPRVNFCPDWVLYAFALFKPTTDFSAPVSRHPPSNDRLSYSALFEQCLVIIRFTFTVVTGIFITPFFSPFREHASAV